MPAGGDEPSYCRPYRRRQSVLFGASRYFNVEGVAKERTYVIGSPMAEVLQANLDKIGGSNVLERLGLEKG